MAGNVVDLLAKAGRAAASADNSQAWCLVWDGASLTVRFRETGGAGPSPGPTNPATLLAMGGVIENILQMGTRLGLDLCPQTGIHAPFEAPVYARIPLDSSSAEVPASALDHPLFERHTNRFAYKTAALPPHLQSELEAMSEGSARLKLLDAAGSVRQMAELIKSASEVRFRVREAHEWLAGSLRFAAADGGDASGLDVRSLDLPPGGSLLLRLTRNWRVMSFLNKLGVYKFMAAADTAPVYAAPALVVITGSNRDTGAIDAGRLLTRAWIRLNEQHLAVHPYYAITDQLTRLRDDTLPCELRDQVLQIEKDCVDYCALPDGESLYMVLRVGYPQVVAPKSKRLPLEQVFRDLTVET